MNPCAQPIPSDAAPSNPVGTARSTSVQTPADDEAAKSAAPALLAALRWLLLSPPLLSDAAAPGVGSTATVARFSPTEQAQIELWLKAESAQPQALVAAVRSARDKVQGRQPGHLRLGRLAERLLAYFLTHGPLHRLVAENVALRFAPGERPIGALVDHTTRGEIDFLLTHPSGERLHWELAVKYFLCQVGGQDGHLAQPSDFKGPDSAETFDHKLHKLMVRQLGNTPPLPWAQQVWRGEAFARGWMFYRFNEPVPPCAALDPAHCKGWWLPWARWAEVVQVDLAVGAVAAGAATTGVAAAHAVSSPEPAVEQAPTCYVELLRPDWMPAVTLARSEVDASGEAGAQPIANAMVLLSGAEVPAALLAAWHAQAFHRRSARLVVQLRASTDGAQWLEAARYFVMPPEDVVWGCLESGA